MGQSTVQFLCFLGLRRRVTYCTNVGYIHGCGIYNWYNKRVCIGIFRSDIGALFSFEEKQILRRMQLFKKSMNLEVVTNYEA